MNRGISIAAGRALWGVLCFSMAGCGLFEFRGTDGKTALYEAVEARDLAEVMRQVDEGANVDAWNGYREDALPGLRFFQGEDASLGLRPLHAAARLGEEEIVRYLIVRGADVDIRDRLGETPLWLAASNGAGRSLAVAELLLESGAAVDAASLEGVTPLMRAVRNGHEELAKLLIERGAEVNHAAPDGRTALHEAAERGYTAIARALLEGGADANAALAGGQKPLQLAVLAGHTEVIAALLEAGADPNDRVRGTSPLLTGAAFRGQGVIVRLLLDYGASPKEAVEGWTALHHAAENGQSEVIADLIHCGADSERVEPDGGRTPLQLAVLEGKVDAVQALLDAGADPDGGVSPVTPPLAKAARDGRLEIVRLLVDYGANIDRRLDGWTPLRMAEFGGHTEIVEFLKERGAGY